MDLKFLKDYFFERELSNNELILSFLWNKDIYTWPSEILIDMWLILMRPAEVIEEQLKQRHVTF